MGNLWCASPGPFLTEGLSPQLPEDFCQESLQHQPHLNCFRWKVASQPWPWPPPRAARPGDVYVKYKGLASLPSYRGPQGSGFCWSCLKVSFSCCPVLLLSFSLQSWWSQVHSLTNSSTLISLQVGLKAGHPLWQSPSCLPTLELTGSVKDTCTVNWARSGQVRGCLEIMCSTFPNLICVANSMMPSSREDLLSSFGWYSEWTASSFPIHGLPQLQRVDPPKFMYLPGQPTPCAVTRAHCGTPLTATLAAELQLWAKALSNLLHSWTSSFAQSPSSYFLPWALVSKKHLTPQTSS